MRYTWINCVNTPLPYLSLAIPYTHTHTQPHTHTHTPPSSTHTHAYKEWDKEIHRERCLLTLTSDIKQEKKFENLFLLTQNILKRNERWLKSNMHAKKKESI